MAETSRAMHPPLAILPVTDAALWEAARALRHRVFVEEQACPPEEEWDAYDWPTDQGRTCRHLLGFEGERPAAVCRWRPVEAAGETWAKLERFAVAPEARGHGYGRAMVEAAMEDARREGHTRFMLYAQDHLRGFYGTWGFQASGDVFWDVGIPHVKMTLEG